MKKKPKPPAGKRRVSSSFELLADIRSLQKIRQAIEAQAVTLGISRNRIYRVLLAVEEATSNVIRHAYDGKGKSKPLYIDVEMSRHAVKILIRDVGKTFNFERHPSNRIVRLALQKRSRGGYGVHLIKSIMDKYEYVRNADGENHLRLVKKL